MMNDEKHEDLNPMCKDCDTKRSGKCKGTTEKVWTGCAMKPFKVDILQRWMGSTKIALR